MNSNLPPLTEAQLEIMDWVWERSECTVSEVWDILRSDRDVARNTILTLMARLEEKGWLSRVPHTRPIRYRATVAREIVERRHLKRLLDGHYGGSAAHLVKSLLGHDLVNSKQLEKIKEMIDRAENKGRG